jgi:tight adherence protein C
MMLTRLLFLVTAAIALMAGFSFVSILFSARRSREIDRLLQLVETTRPDTRTLHRRERFLAGLTSLFQSLGKRFGLRLSRKSLNDLQLAGFRGPHAPDTFLAIQCLLPLAGIFAASFFSENLLFWSLALAAAGYLVPNLWLTARVRARRECIRRSLPDAMDLLVICVDAGLGMDQALLRVSSDLAISHPELEQEFGRVHLQQRAGIPRLDAWKDMAERARIPELASFVSMLTQTERFGTPVARALARFAEDLRNARKQKAEEAAAKTKVKIVFPLVFCIFPCLFLVLLAPSLLEIGTLFQGINPN